MEWVAAVVAIAKQKHAAARLLPGKQNTDPATGHPHTVNVRVAMWSRVDSLSMPALPAQGQEQKRKPSNSNSYNDSHGQITPYKEQAPSLPADACMNSTHRFGDGCQ
jgi:hypothetical protein